MSDEILLDIQKFKLLSRIGSGTFSEVFKIEDTFGNIFAAKISLKVLEDQSLIKCILQEINIISKLNHSSILRFIGFSQHNFYNEEKYAIITEYSITLL